MKRSVFSQNRAETALVFFLSALETLGSVGVAVILSLQMDAVSAAITEGTPQPLYGSTAICLAYAACLGLILRAAEGQKARWKKKVLLSVREAAFRGVVRQPPSVQREQNSAGQIALLTAHMGTLEEQYFGNVLTIAETCLTIVAAGGILIWFSPVIAVVSVAAMSLPALLPKLFGGRLARRRAAILESTAAYTARVKDALTGLEILQTYHAQPRAEALHAAAAAALETDKARLSGTMAQLQGLSTAASVSVQFLIMMFAGAFAAKGVITIGSIVAVTQLTGQVIAPAFRLSGQIAQLRATTPIWEEVEDLSARAESEEEALPELHEALTLKNVSFSYGQRPVLKAVNAVFKRGRKYAITGKSGSGKSTLLHLLAGDYPCREGEILVDGRPERVCDHALIHQNVFLFDDTIRNNITLWGDFPETAIAAAVTQAGLQPVVEALPEGLETAVEENGARFSGGERQRIAVARALLHKKSLMLVDEATSALDRDTARAVEESILGLEGVTCIVITHRLDPEIAGRYDALLALKDGALEAYSLT